MSERERLFAKLKEVPFLEPYPSHANFILAKVWHEALDGGSGCSSSTRLFRRNIKINCALLGSRYSHAVWVVAAGSVRNLP